ncbi:MAG: DegV family protein, partial [Clostridia bacterium]|nr:DegV family protein [Clostridia bacterium]
MEYPFTIVTDTSANLPTPMVEENGIVVVPLTYSLEGREHVCLDTVDFANGKGEEFYAKLKSGVKVTTSQIT